MTTMHWPQLHFGGGELNFDDMKVEEPDLAGTYSYADYLTWQLPEMVELIRGKIFRMSPAPSSRHQKVSGKLFLRIGNFLERQKCQVFSATFDVRLPLKEKSDKEINTVVQPDLCVICDPSKIDDRGCLGAPDWIIENYHNILHPKTCVRNLTYTRKQV
jgi:Uma2 family endonuclease